MMTGRERMGNILRRQPVDRIGVFEGFWGDTYRQWVQDGSIKAGDSLSDIFGYDLDAVGAFNMVADLDFANQTVEETEETILIRDGNGALLRRHKLHDSTPEHVDFVAGDMKGLCLKPMSS